MQDDRRQQVMRVQPLDDRFGEPLEEPAQPQVGHDHHHREQQDDGREVDRSQGLVGPDDAEGHHQDGADDRRAGAVDLHPRELAEREDEVAAEENEIGGEDPRVGQQRGIEVLHRAEVITDSGRSTCWAAPGRAFTAPSVPAFSV